jgi:hypothetical protein
MPCGIFPPSDPSGQVSKHSAPRLRGHVGSTRPLACQLTAAVCIAWTHLTSGGVHGLSSSATPQAPVSSQPSCEECIKHLSSGLCISLFIRSGWRWLFETSLIHCALFLPCGWPTLEGEPVGLITFRIAKLRMGWVPSLRRSPGCLWMGTVNCPSPYAAHNRRLSQPSLDDFR